MSRLALALAVLAGPALADGPDAAVTVCGPETAYLASVHAIDPGVTRSTTDRLVLDLRDYCRGRVPLAVALGIPEPALVARVFDGPDVPPVPAGQTPSPVPVPPALALLGAALAGLALTRRTA